MGEQTKNIKPKNVHEALAIIQSKMFVKKENEKNGGGGKFNYRTVEQILKKIQETLVANQILATVVSTEEVVCKGTPLVAEIDAVEKYYENKESFTRNVRRLVDVGSRYYVKSTACFTYKGESVCSTTEVREQFSKNGMDDAQLSSATSTYAQKGALCKLFAIQGEKDIDELFEEKQAEEEKKAVKQMINKKTNIITLLQKIGKQYNLRGNPEEARQAIQSDVESITGEEFKEENYDTIIEKLTIVSEENAETEKSVYEQALAKE